MSDGDTRKAAKPAAAEGKQRGSGLFAAIGIGAKAGAAPATAEEAVRAVLKSPLARVYAWDALWICPMCERVGGEFGPASGWADEASAHLLEECTAVRSGTRVPRATLEQLQQSALSIGVRHLLRTDPLWQCVDRSGRWHCPYCLECLVRLPTSPAAAAAADAAAVVAHAEKCYAFQRGAGRPKPLAQVRDAVQQANAKLDRAIQMLLMNPVAKVFSFDLFWICPLCCGLLPEISPAAGWTAPATRHLRDDCPAVREGSLAPKFPPEQLRKGVLAQAIPHIVKANPRWRVFDRAGRWYCPFCVQSGVTLAKPGTVQPRDMKAIADHVVKCFYFDSGRGTPKDPAVVQEAVQLANAKLDAVQGLGPLLAKDPVWRVRDRNGCWVCPYCRRGVASVNFSPSRPEAAVDDVGLHLTRHCDAYRQKKAPAKDAAELTSSGPQPLAVARTVQETREVVQVDKRVYDMLVKIAQEAAQVKTQSAEAEKTMRAAQKRQMRMLPKPPHLAGFDVDVLFRPSDRLSGDFYDFLQVDADHIGFLIGDVSGHGVDAALVMAMVKKVISLAGMSRPSPKDVLTYANELIRPDLERGTFISACYGLLDMKERVLRFARAGHNPLLVYNPARSEVPIALRPDGMALGVVDSTRMEASLEEMEVALKPGDFVLLYTDGVVEQDNPAGDMLHLDGFLDLIRLHATGTAPELLERIAASLDVFRAAKAQEDDITIVGLKVL